MQPLVCPPWRVCVSAQACVLWYVSLNPILKPTLKSAMVMMMRPFGKFYSAHCSVHMKWRVATHSDHSCCGRVSEGLWCCNLICLSCKVKAFIISARGIRCHLHWTWHMHAPLTMGDHTHTHTHSEHTQLKPWGTRLRDEGFEEKIDRKTQN